MNKSKFTSIALFPGTDAIESSKMRALAWQDSGIQSKLRQAESILKRNFDHQIDLCGYMTSENDVSLEGFQKLVLCSLATQVALFENFKAQGGEVDAVMGLSLGDIARSVVSGLCSFEEAVCILFKFTALSSRIEDGLSIHIKLDRPFEEMRTELMLADYDIEISVMQNDSFFMAAGRTSNVKQWIKDVAAPLDIHYRVLYPFPLHSSLMNPVSTALSAEIQTLCKGDQSKYQIFSTVFAKGLEKKEDIVADSVLNINSTLRFTDTIHSIIEKYQSVEFINIGPAPTLLLFIERMKLNNSAVRLEDWFGTRTLNLA